MKTINLTQDTEIREAYEFTFLVADGRTLDFSINAESYFVAMKLIKKYLRLVEQTEILMTLAAPFSRG